MLKNIDRFHGQQDVGDHGTPLLIPLFTPTRHNAGEEKSWFERWPYGVSAAHSIAPAATRLIVLADGRIVSNDTSGTTLGVVGQTPIGQAWLSFLPWHARLDRADKMPFCARRPVPPLIRRE